MNGISRNKPAFVTMSNPFNNYRSQVDTSEITLAAKRSANASQRRARMMKSSDPKVRAQATGNLGQLSGTGENVGIKKSSHLG